MTAIALGGPPAPLRRFGHGPATSYGEPDTLRQRLCASARGRTSAG
ncbi:MAG TPA: hypothetical protein PL117_09420 [Accumulibacter sp.]|nr:hypothetical protein [Accumulibacter sp.]